MKIAMSLMLVLVLAGCATIRHKSFLASNNVMGIKISTVDPTGSGGPTPNLLFGNIHSLTATCVPGSKITVDAQTSSMIHDKEAYKLHAIIDSTKVPEVKINDKEIHYKPNK